jgi:hypothetical protein
MKLEGIIMLNVEAKRDKKPKGLPKVETEARRCSYVNCESQKSLLG